MSNPISQNEEININESGIRELLADWHRRAKQSQRVQYDSGKKKNILHYALGVPTIILSSVVGTAIFASIGGENSLTLKIITGSISIVAASLASLQTFLGYNEKAEKYKLHSAKYGAVRREIELLMLFIPKDKDLLQKSLQDIKLRLDELAESSQNISDKIKRKAVADLGKKPRKNKLFKSFDEKNE